jgi:hypothetical protein
MILEGNRSKWYQWMSIRISIRMGETMEVIKRGVGINHWKLLILGRKWMGWRSRVRMRMIVFWWNWLREGKKKRYCRWLEKKKELNFKGLNI